MTRASSSVPEYRTSILPRSLTSFWTVAIVCWARAPPGIFFSVFPSDLNPPWRKPVHAFSTLAHPFSFFQQQPKYLQKSNPPGAWVFVTQKADLPRLRPPHFVPARQHLFDHI